MTIPVLPTELSWDPDEASGLAIAYENACAAVCGREPAPQLRQRVAERILVLAQGGMRDSVQLYLACKESFLSPEAE